jgi:hypothetical protein
MQKEPGTLEDQGSNIWSPKISRNHHQLLGYQYLVISYQFQSIVRLITMDSYVKYSEFICMFAMSG